MNAFYTQLLEQPLHWDTTNASSFLQIDPRNPSIVRNGDSKEKWQAVASKQIFTQGINMCSSLKRVIWYFEEDGVVL